MTELPFVGRSVCAATLISAALFVQSGIALSQPEPVPFQARLASVLGRDVTPPKGVERGRIIDVLIDGDGQVHAFVVEFGGFLGIGTRKIAVERAAFRFADSKILVEVSGEQIQAARDYTAGEPPYIVKAETAPRD
jgi:hypothetical protein